MCLNPLWRCAVPSYVVHSMYLSKDILKKYKNGGFVFLLTISLHLSF